MKTENDTEKFQSSAYKAQAEVTLPDATKPIEEQEALTLLAMCLFGEARGESREAMRAVAQVIVNRARHAHGVFGSRRDAGFEENLRRVILKPKQFSCMLPGDINYGKLLKPLEFEDPGIWDACLECAAQATNERDCEDTLTANSDHYYDDSILPPAWAQPANKTVKVGRLNFYRLYLPSQTSSHRRPEGKPAETPPDPFPAPKPRTGHSGAMRATARQRRMLAGSGSRPHTSMPAPSHATVLNSQHRWEIRSGWLASLMLAAVSVLLAGCSELERTAYQTLTVTKAEYETVQQHMVEASLQGLISEEQWKRFALAGNRFILAHNAAVDAFVLWSNAKNKNAQENLALAVEELPRLIRQLNELVRSFEPPAETPPVEPTGAAMTATSGRESWH